MDPLRHASLLRQIGIAWYVPRKKIETVPALPVHTMVRTAVVSATGLPSQHTTKPLVSTPRVTVATVQTETTAKPEPAALAAPLNYNFYVVAYSGMAIFVASINTPSLTTVWEQSARVFMDDVVRACTGKAPPPAWTGYLNWPMPGRKQLSDQDSAEYTAGFLRGVLNDSKATTVFLMGASAQQTAGAALPAQDSLRLLEVPSLGRLFTEPAAKAELWRKCQTD